MAKNKGSILSEMYRSFELSIENRQYRRACKTFIRSLKYSPFYFAKTIFNRRIKYFSFIKEILFRYKYRMPMIKAYYALECEMPIVVSLTSYPARFPTLHIVLKSLLKQTLKPTKVVLYLDKWVGIKEVPWKVRRLQKYGLEIKIECEDIKPHNKYYYAMQEFHDSIIITVDDDQIYPNNLVSSLYESYQKHPKSISARRVMKIIRDENGNAIRSNSWQGECTTIKVPSMELLAQGVGGVLYPPNIFDLSQFYFDIENIKKYCLNADDMWLKFIEKRENIPVVWVQNELCFHAIHYEGRLMNNNVLERENDIQIKKCEQLFDVNI